MTTLERATRVTFHVKSFKTVMVMLLACLLMAMGSAQIRSTVMRIQAEAGLQRVFETEVHSAGPALQLNKEEKLGRKPYEHLEWVEAAHDRLHLLRSPAPVTAASGPRGPPYAQRGPPITA